MREIPAGIARHLHAPPTLSVAHIDHEDLAVFADGQAECLTSSDPRWEETLAHWAAHYGGSPLDWGEDIRPDRLAASWMVGYASDREKPVGATP
jgi:hypothetical protein